MKKIKRELSSREFLALTLPFIISTMTQPLLGAVDTAVMGRLPDESYIASVSVGAVLFNTLYWLFGFLRVSTSGYAAQALGAESRKDEINAFFRPISLAVVVGFLCIIFQKAIVESYMWMISPESEVINLASQYFYILIWGAPFVLINYVSLGWLMGQTRLKASLFMQISSNLLNIILDILFVMHFNLGIKGVASATLISQIYGFIVGIIFMYMYGKFKLDEIPFKTMFEKSTFINMILVNANLMIRTLCLLVVNNVFTATSATFGTAVLAANAIITQIQSIMSYAIDGMANGASVFTGKAIGKKSKRLFCDTKYRSTQWMIVLVLILSGTYFFNSRFFIGIFTDMESVIDISLTYSIYALLYPAVSCAGIVYYGIFTGATITAPVRNMMIMSMMGFLISRYFLIDLMGNHGLWISYMIYKFLQTIIMTIMLKNLESKIDIR